MSYYPDHNADYPDGHSFEQEPPEDHYDEPSDEEIELWEQLKDEREIERSWQR